MIVDCFPFYNEIELLEIRLEELKNVVDRFILVEAGQTYSGKQKPFFFEENQERFRQYDICYLRIPAFPQSITGSLQREEYTRNSLVVGLQHLDVGPDDIVMLSDLDEIPRAHAVAQCAYRLTNGETDCFVFDQALSYYYVNCCVDETWHGTRMVRVRDLTTFHALRTRSGTVVSGGGWHFSYLGGTQRIQQKIAASIHTELDRPDFNNRAHIERCLSEGVDLFGRNMCFHVVPLDSTFPHFLLANQQRFRHLIAISQTSPSAATLFERALRTPSDIHQHLGYLFRLASTVQHVTELGTRSGNSTIAFLYARPQYLVAYDIERATTIPSLESAAQELGVDFVFRQEDVLSVEIDPTDLLFIDTWHVEQQIREELVLHANRSRRYLVFHDTESFAFQGETPGHRGIWFAIAEFMKEQPQWRLLQHFSHNNGLTVFTRVASE